jgi:hypothetical protein
MKTPALAVTITLALASIAGAADARGCVKGAVVGGVAGHFAHRHTVLGAAVGCAVGHHMAAKQDRERQAELRAGQHR